MIAGNPAGSVSEATGPESRTAGGARRAAHEAIAAREKELLQLIRRHGQLTVAGAALKTSLSVKEAGRMLSELTGRGCLEVRVGRGRLLYSLREGRG
jgi:predicted ArsR family transcriptional regulator